MEKFEDYHVGMVLKELPVFAEIVAVVAVVTVVTVVTVVEGSIIESRLDESEGRQ